MKRAGVLKAGKCEKHPQDFHAPKGIQNGSQTRLSNFQLHLLNCLAESIGPNFQQGFVALTTQGLRPAPMGIDPEADVSVRSGSPWRQFRLMLRGLGPQLLD